MIKRALLNTVFVNIVFFLCFFINVKKLPIRIETQPLFIFLISLFFLAFIKIKIKGKDIFLVMHIAILTMYCFIQLLFFKSGFPEYVSYIIGPILYLAISDKANLVSVKALKFVIVFLFILGSILFLRIPILIDLIELFYSAFIERAHSISGYNDRGIILLAPEPSYFAFPAVFLLFFLDFHIKNGKRNLIYYKILLFILIILTKSALVFFYIGLYLLGYYILGNYKKIFQSKLKNIITIFILILVFPLISFENSRPSKVYNRFKSALESKQPIREFMIREPSGSTRILINAMAFNSLVSNPFGWGLGEFENNIHKVGEDFDYILKRHEVLKKSYLEGARFRAQTYFTNLLGDVGLLSIVFSIFIFLSFVKKIPDQKYKSGLLMVLPFMLVFFQGQLSNPIIWFLLAFFNANDSFKYEKKNVNDVLSSTISYKWG